MAKKETTTKKMNPKKENQNNKKDIKIQGATSLNPQVGKWEKPYPEGNDQFKLTKNIESVLKKDISKSEKMRNLYKIQVTSNKEIAYFCNAHPSFVHTVISKMKKEIKKGNSK